LISSNKSVDLLFALQRMKADIYVVAQQFALRPRQSFFAGDFGSHAFEGVVLTAGCSLCIRRKVGCARAPMLDDQ
jgi:hypothetical protein